MAKDLAAQEKQFADLTELREPFDCTTRRTSTADQKISRTVF